ncbi:YbaY family lipoprotein [Marilutibacter maris]|nr:YbaY family lipoprotein [Lysobacter maris]
MPSFRRSPPILSILALATSLALAGCQPDPGAPAPSTAGNSDNAGQAAPARSRIVGSALYRERIATPPGAYLRVQLIDNLLADTPKAVLAETRVENIGPPPIGFELDYDPASLRDDGQYGLHASLYGPDESLLFVTDVRHALQPGSEAPVELLLRHVAAGSGTDATAAVANGALTNGALINEAVAANTGQRRHWQCGELRVDADLDATTGDTTLSFSGRRLVLAQTPAASGTRHADDAGNEFRSKGENAVLTLAGRPQLECTLSDTPSSWTQAADRGIGFRAAGNEPGWWIEVGMGESPAITATLDYGERVLEIAHARPDGAGYTGTTADGVELRLEIDRRPCTDGMSGEAFEAGARLQVGGKGYRGCGAFLFD